jgi:hypothetical protein
VTEQADKHVWEESTNPPPDKCPTNTAHTIDATKTWIEESAGDAQVYTPDGEARIVQDPNIGEESYHFIPNFCDRTSWWQDASYEVQFEMRDKGTGTVWDTGVTPAHTFWVDGSHGGIMHENIVDYTLQQMGYPSIIPVVEVYETDQWVTKTEDSQDPNFLDDPLNAGDFYIDYRNGEIHFHTSQAGKQVRASFYKAQASLTYVLEASPGYKSTIEFARILATDNVTMTCPIVYTLMNGETVLGQYIYEDLYQIQQDAGGVDPAYPAIGGSTPIGHYKTRGTANPTYSLPMHYLRAREMNGDLQSKLVVTTAKEWVGEFALGIMYGALKEIES